MTDLLSQVAKEIYTPLSVCFFRSTWPSALQRESKPNLQLIPSSLPEICSQRPHDQMEVEEEEEEDKEKKKKNETE